MKLPDEHGHFGAYGGRFVAETLIEPLQELARPAPGIFLAGDD